MNVLSLVAHRYASLTQSEQRVADYLQRHPSDVLLLSLQALATQCGTSDSTVLRFCRSLGFSGYIDFKAALIPDLMQQGASLHTDISNVDDFQQVSRKINANLSAGISATFNSLGEKGIQRLAQAIHRANRVVLVGLAGSAGVARIFADSLLTIGYSAFCFSDRVEIERITSLLQPDDLLIAISHSGETEEACKAVERAKARGVLTCGLTNSSPSTLSSLADLVVLTTIAENLLGSYSCFSRIVQLAVFELVITQLLVLAGSE